MPWETVNHSHYVQNPYLLVYVMPYYMVEIENQFNIYKHINFQWKYIMTLPKFPIRSAEQLAHKLQTIMVFS